MNRPRPAGLMRPVEAATETVTTETPTSPPVSSVVDEMWTDEDVMGYLKVNRQWLRDHTTRVEPIVPHIKLGREIRYPKCRVLAWVAGQVETRPTWERDAAGTDE